MIIFLIYFCIPVHMSPCLLSRLWVFGMAEFFYFSRFFGLYSKMLLGGRKIFTM